MLQAFIAFHINGITNLIYTLTSNVWMFLIIIGFVGTIGLNLKERVDTSVNEEQNII